MTMPDFGAERPGQASETRQLVERTRSSGATVLGNRGFLLSLVVIVLSLVAIVLALRT